MIINVVWIDKTPKKEFLHILYNQLVGASRTTTTKQVEAKKILADDKSVKCQVVIKINRFDKTEVKKFF